MLLNSVFVFLLSTLLTCSLVALFHVCVVELVGAETLNKNQSSSKFILVKRPEEGLLAGLWEFPSVLLDGEAVPLARREAMDRFLEKNLKIDIRKTCNIVLREDIGEFVHIFSHIRLKLYVELLVLQLKGASLTFYIGITTCYYD